MHKVITINLAGQAYQLEEAAYQNLTKYLDQAKRRLKDNPDTDEILADLERAIGEKCQQRLATGKDVVTTSEVATIIQEMGPVESDADDSDDTAHENSARPKRLYAIPDGAFFAGVCNGIGAYFDVDVTVIRFAFAFLTVATSGFWILLYLFLAVILPKARTDKERAEAHGYPVTARQIVDRAKTQAGNMQPALTEVGQAIRRIARILAKVAKVVLTIVLGVLTAIWAWALWAWWSGDLALHDQLATIPRWEVGVALTAAYLLFSLPVVSLIRLCDRITDGRRPSNTLVSGMVAGLWGIAVASLICLGALQNDAIRAYATSHNGYLDIGKHHYCLDDQKCGSYDQRHPMKYVPATPPEAQGAPEPIKP